jgi:hypothetical protein
MTMKFDPSLATEAKALVALAFRNGPIEREGRARLAMAVQRSPTSPARR